MLREAFKHSVRRRPPGNTTVSSAAAREHKEQLILLQSQIIVPPLFPLQRLPFREAPRRGKDEGHGPPSKESCLACPSRAATATPDRRLSPRWPPPLPGVHTASSPTSASAMSVPPSAASCSASPKHLRRRRRRPALAGLAWQLPRGPGEKRSAGRIAATGVSLATPWHLDWGRASSGSEDCISA